MPDSDRPSIVQRLRDARIVRILLAFLGASWIVLWLVDVLVGRFSLPNWVNPVAVVLLAVGLVVFLATAWVQAHPATKAAEEAGQVPTDWEVAPGDAVSALLKGRVPHLTWGRALMGGVLAMSSLLGAAGIYVLVAGGEEILGTRGVGAEGLPEAVVVLPFSAPGEGMALDEEEMVGLLGADLSEVGQLRIIDPRTVVSRWRDEVGESSDVPLDQALTLARGLGGRYAVRGRAVRVGEQVSLVAEVYDLVDGSHIDDARVEGPADEVPGLVDALTERLTAIFVATTGGTAP
jgi:TolB-like protein